MPPTLRREGPRLLLRLTVAERRQIGLSMLDFRNRNQPPDRARLAGPAALAFTDIDEADPLDLDDARLGVIVSCLIDSLAINSPAEVFMFMDVTVRGLHDLLRSILAQHATLTDVPFPAGLAGRADSARQALGDLTAQPTDRLTALFAEFVRDRARALRAWDRHDSFLLGESIHLTGAELRRRDSAYAAAIAPLRDDPDAAVRLVTALELLDDAPETALPVLSELTAYDNKWIRFAAKDGLTRHEQGRRR